MIIDNNCYQQQNRPKILRIKTLTTLVYIWKCDHKNYFTDWRRLFKPERLNIRWKGVNSEIELNFAGPIKQFSTQTNPIKIPYHNWVWTLSKTNCWLNCLIKLAQHIVQSSRKSVLRLCHWVGLAKYGIANEWEVSRAILQAFKHQSARHLTLDSLHVFTARWLQSR